QLDKLSGTQGLAPARPTRDEFVELIAPTGAMSATSAVVNAQSRLSSVLAMGCASALLRASMQTHCAARSTPLDITDASRRVRILQSRLSRASWAESAASSRAGAL